MLPRLREAKYQGDYRIWLKFEDGVEGEVDLENELWCEVFEVLYALTMSLSRREKVASPSCLWRNFVSSTALWWLVSLSTGL